MSIIVFLVSKLRNSGVQLNFNFTFDIKSQKAGTWDNTCTPGKSFTNTSYLTAMRCDKKSK